MMDINIITKPFHLEIYGFGEIATNKNYVDTALKLSGKMWDIVKANNLSNKGKNVWVYDIADKVFAGVELDNPNDGVKDGLERMKIVLTKYAHFKHVGAYNLIKTVGQKMSEELMKQKYEPTLPYIEIYGHWSADETKLETELIMCLK